MKHSKTTILVHAAYVENPGKLKGNLLETWYISSNSIFCFRPFPIYDNVRYFVESRCQLVLLILLHQYCVTDWACALFRMPSFVRILLLVALTCLFVLTSYFVFAQTRRHWWEGGISPPNNLPRLYIEVLYSVLFTHCSIDFYQIWSLGALLLDMWCPDILILLCDKLKATSQSWHKLCRNFYLQLRE